MGTRLEAAENVTVVALPPGAATTLAGKNCAVSPAGNPLTVNVTAALKVEFGAVVSVRVLDVPGATLIEPADKAIANVGAGATVSDNAAVCFAAPLLAATVRE